MANGFESGVAFNTNSVLREIKPGDGPKILADLAVDGAAMLGVIRIKSAGRENLWERHPQGDEVLIMIEGRATMIMRENGGDKAYVLGPGDVLFIPKGVAHSAEFHTEEVQVLFLTPRHGTEVWREEKAV